MKTAIVIAPPAQPNPHHGAIRPSSLIGQRVEIVRESRVIRGKPLYEVRAQDGTTETLNEVELSMWSEV